MALPALNEKLARFKPQPAIPKGKEAKVEGVLVTGTGYPYYAFQSSRGKSLITLNPRKPSGAPIEERQSTQYKGDAEKDEDLLGKVVTLRVPYNEASKSTGEGFFDASSNEDRIRVYDGREWIQYNGSYWVQFNWQTKTQATLGASKRITKRQMERVLDNLITSGGSVESAIRKLCDNRFIAGDQELFWTADGRRYRMVKGKWVQQEEKGAKSGVQPPEDGDGGTKNEGSTTATGLKPDLGTLETRYPTRKTVRGVRTWAGPRNVKITSLEQQQLPPNPSSSRPGDRGVKRKKDDAKDNDDPPENRGDSGPPRKRGGKKPATIDPPTKPGTRSQPKRNAKK